MIDQKTIDTVRDLDIHQVISSYGVDLKKAGANYKAKSPFTEEKTPSFVVSPVKGIYKCFSTGKGGDAISFVMDLTSATFYEAIIDICGKMGITVEYDGTDEATRKERQDKFDRISKVLAAAHREYGKAYMEAPFEVTGYVEGLGTGQRGYTRDTLITFQLGYVPASKTGTYLTDKIGSSEYRQDAIDIGLLSYNPATHKTYDYFRDRWMIPIHDHNGVLRGFGGRVFPHLDSGKAPKYLNSPEGKEQWFKKSNILYGLNITATPIGKADEAILVEGYTDVHSFYQSGINNVVASCGTSLTIDQAKLLSKYCSKVTICYDGDSAGAKAMVRAIPLLIQAGLSVYSAILPEGYDPDSWIRSHTWDQAHVVDSVLWLASQYWDHGDIGKRGKALNNIAELLEMMDEDVVRDSYIQAIAQHLDITKTRINEAIKRRKQERLNKQKRVDFDNQRHHYRLPKGVEWDDVKSDIINHGFFTWASEMYFIVYSKDLSENPHTFKKASNFVFEILYHIEHERTPRRIVRIKNVRNRERIFDTETDTFASPMNFKKMLLSKGNYQWTGQPAHFDQLVGITQDQMKDCQLVDILGWQLDDFWCFNNGFISNGKFIESTDDGIIEYEDQFYYIPSGNKIYKNNKHKFKNQKQFVYLPSQLKFGDWSRKILQVYGDNGMMMMLYTISCVFSDIIFERYAGFPITFLYGDAGGGKGSLVKSMQRLFGIPQEPMTITGKANTDKAKIREFAQFVNSMLFLDEFSNSINEDVVNMLKGLWDRFGYKRASMDYSFNTESVPISSGVVIAGNEYPTDDPLLTRLVVLEIDSIDVDKLTPEQKQNFNELKEIERDGVSSLMIDILNQREDIKQHFKETFKEQYKRINERHIGLKLVDRMIFNVTVLATVFKVTCDKLDYGFDMARLDLCIDRTIIAQNSKRSTGGEVQKFWDIVLSLASQKQIIHGKEYKLDGDSLFIRFKEIHALYQVEHRKREGKAGLAQQTLLDKLKSSEAYIEVKRGIRFDGKNTSGHQFNYDKINIDLLTIIEFLESEHKRKNGYTGTYEDKKEEKQQEGEISFSNPPF